MRCVSTALDLLLRRSRFLTFVDVQCAAIQRKRLRRKTKAVLTHRTPKRDSRFARAFGQHEGLFANRFADRLVAPNSLHDFRFRQRFGKPHVQQVHRLLLTPTEAIRDLRSAVCQHRFGFDFAAQPLFLR